MAYSNKTSTNFVGGELSPLMYGRLDLPIYQKSSIKCENFIAIPQGGIAYRNGLTFVKNTKQNKLGVFIPFQFSDQQAYLIEATDKKFRFYKDNGVITETSKAITAGGITQANPGRVNLTAHGFSNGDEIYIDGVQGMTQVNGRFFTVSNVLVNSFTLTDSFGVGIDTTAYTAYTSGGTVARVYEISTPYLEIDLPYLQYAQTADTMYVVCKRGLYTAYEPRKLTRAGHASWTLATYARTADPFTPTAKNVTAGGITQANPGVVNSTAHGFSIGDALYVTGVVGMTQLNGNFYLVGTVPGANQFTLTDLNGVPVNTTGFTAWSSGGTFTKTDEWPGAVAFTDSSRLVFANTRLNPETIWGSKAPSTGVPAYDNFTTGVGATDAIIFTLSAVHGKVDSIQWITNTSKSLTLGTFGAIRRLYGGTEQEAISATSVTAKSVNAFGCAATLPVSNGTDLFYIQRGNAILRSMEFDITIDDYTTVDRNLVADHLTKSGIKSLTEQQGKPDVIWGIRNDGKFIGLTYKQKEDISGWHRHFVGGKSLSRNGVLVNYAKVIDMGRMPRADKPDQVWFIVERQIGANTVRSVEYMADAPDFPMFEEFYSGADNEAADKTKFLNYLYEVQKDANHLDMSVAFDGSALGLAANAALTFSATTGGAVTVTASNAVFTSNMVGREIWKKYDENGDGGGCATITGFTDSTHVTVNVTVALDNVNQIPAGNWFLTATSISGLHHLEGQTVSVLVDGGPGNDRIVTAGAITLDTPASKVIAGLPYRGFFKTLNIDSGGTTGSANAKPRNVAEMAIRFLNSLGAEIGTSEYALDEIVFEQGDRLLDRPVPLFSGNLNQNYSDSWTEDEKNIVIVQNRPVPCTVLSIDVFMDTVDERTVA